jgi:hypothetical protein
VKKVRKSNGLAGECLTGFSGEARWEQAIGCINAVISFA